MEPLSVEEGELFEVRLNAVAVVGPWQTQTSQAGYNRRSIRHRGRRRLMVLPPLPSLDLGEVLDRALRPPPPKKKTRTLYTTGEGGGAAASLSLIHNMKRLLEHSLAPKNGALPSKAGN